MASQGSTQDLRSLPRGSKLWPLQWRHGVLTTGLLGKSLQCFFPESQFSSVQSLSLVQLFATPQIAARQASLSIKSVMPSNYLILYHPLFPFLSLVKVIQLCRTLWDPMDYTVHGLLQARILEWVAFSFSRVSSLPRSPSLQEDSLPAETQGGSPIILEWVAYPFASGSSWPRVRTGVSWIAGGIFTNWAIREVHGHKEWDTTEGLNWNEWDDNSVWVYCSLNMVHYIDWFPC